MIDVIQTRTGLYYTTPYGHVRWHWLDAPRYVRQAYRNRPDFWANAPYCIVKQYI